MNILSLLRERYYLCETSPSGLRYVTSRGRCKKGSVAGRVDSTGYYQVRVGNNKCIQAHRAIVLMAGVTGCEMLQNKEFIVDHIDRNRSNNSPNNLRVVNYRINASNSKRSIDTGLPLGVCEIVIGGLVKYRSQAYINGKNKTLGDFKTKEEASEVYLKFVKSKCDGNVRR